MTSYLIVRALPTSVPNNEIILHVCKVKKKKRQKTKNISEPVLVIHCNGTFYYYYSNILIST